LKPSIFQLVDKPRVTKNIFQLNKEFNFPGELSLEIDNNIKVIKMFEEDKNAIVVLNLTFFKGRIFEEIPFKLEIEIEGLFSWGDELENKSDRLEFLLNENAPAILYSYLRPMITTITLDANLPPLVIPLMNFREQNQTK